MNENIEDIYEEKRLLENQVEELTERIKQAESSDLRYLICKYIFLKNPSNKKRIGKNEIDFEEWQKGIEEIYKRKIATLQKESEGLRKILFKKNLDIFLKLNPEFNKIPFAYCDVNRQLLCTNSVYELFSINHKENLTLKDLLKHIEKEDAKYIFESLKSGKRIKDYKLKDTRNLSINSYPLYYSNLPVGVAIILESPDLNIEKGKMFRFVRGILRNIKELNSEYNLMQKTS